MMTSNASLFTTVQYNITESSARELHATFLVTVNENRRNFNYDLNCATYVHRQTEAGILFHSLGFEAEKARSSNFRFVRSSWPLSGPPMFMFRLPRDTDFHTTPGW